MIHNPMYRSYVLFNSTIHDDVDQPLIIKHPLNIFKMSLDDTTSQVNVVHHSIDNLFNKQNI